MTTPTLSGDSWTLFNGDCVPVVSELPDASVHLCVHSPPFANLYTYSDSMADMGNCANSKEFCEHYAYLIRQLYRVTVSGRLCAVHCKDLPAYRNRDGYSGLVDFPGDLIRTFQECGWDFHSRVTVWKCPVTERERTNNNGLLHKTVVRDSSQIRQGMADYVLVFRKTPPASEGNLSAVPIRRPDGFSRFVGDPEADPWSTSWHPSPYARLGGSTDDSITVWRRYAEPVWWDINQMDVLNFKVATEGDDEKHICPLQLGLIRRVVELWSQPGDVVLSPFAGIGSEGVVSIQEGRRFIGVELKESYFRLAGKYLRIAERDGKQPTLFGEDHFDETPVVQAVSAQAPDNGPGRSPGEPSAASEAGTDCLGQMGPHPSNGEDHGAIRSVEPEAEATAVCGADQPAEATDLPAGILERGLPLPDGGRDGVVATEAEEAAPDPLLESARRAVWEWAVAKGQRKHPGLDQILAEVVIVNGPKQLDLTDDLHVICYSGLIEGYRGKRKQTIWRAEEAARTLARLAAKAKEVAV